MSDTRSTSSHVIATKDETQLVTFMLENEEFGFDIMSVQEIIRPPKLSKVPNTPSYVQGIANLRGVILPIIDMRPRFGMNPAEDTDHTRVLVIDVGGVKSGLRVDRVKQVTNVACAEIETPPAAIHGATTKYLNGVVKLDAGARLIMSLNASEVCNLGLAATGHAVRAEEVGAKSEVQSLASGPIEENNLQQLVSFQVAKEEFAFPMERVREILRVQSPTKVPGVPEYVLGVLTVRGRLLPIVDLRKKLQLQSMAEESILKCAEVRLNYEQWANASIPGIPREFPSSTSDSFASWVGDFSSSSQVLMDALIGLRSIEEKLGATARHGGIQKSGESTAEESTGDGELVAIAHELATAMASFERLIPLNLQEDQRIVVVDAAGVLLGLVVDHVNEVLQVPSNTIDIPPAITAGDGREVSGIARLDEGKRLLLLLNPAKLLNEPSLEILRKTSGENFVASDAAQGLNTHIEASDTASEDVQLVTFMLGAEEYGIPIAQIQEIDRLSRVTHIPKAGNCVEGITNLRGEVIPIVNTRKRFELEMRDPDDHTRIIIVDLKGVKTGLIVDSVREVLSLSRNELTPPPASMMAGIQHHFISAIGKLDQGKRMIFVLTAEELLPQA